MLVFLVSFFILGSVHILILSLSNSLFLISIDKVLNVLIFLLEFLLDLDIDKFRIVNSDGTGFSFLSHNFINEINGFLRELY